MKLWNKLLNTLYQTVSSRRTDKYDNVKQNLISCSNAIYFIASPFNQLSISTKSFLGIKKSQLQ